MWERKRTLCPPPSGSRRCHGTSPLPSPSLRTQCPRASSPGRCGRWGAAAFPRRSRVPTPGSQLPPNPAVPLGDTRKGGCRDGCLSCPPCSASRGAGSLERCPVSGHLCPGPGSPSPSVLPRARTADISPSHAASQPLSRPRGPQVFRSRPCVRLSGVASLASLLPWISLGDTVRGIRGCLRTGAGRSVAGPFTQEVKGRCLTLNCVMDCCGEKMRGRPSCLKQMECPPRAKPPSLGDLWSAWGKD